MALSSPAVIPFQGGTTPDEEPHISQGAARYILLLVTLAVVSASIVIQVFAALITPMKSALDLSDTQLGLLQGVGWNLCFALAAIPIGFLIDHGSRVRLLLVMSLSWSGFTALTGLVQNFWQLFICHCLIGVAQAGMYPAIYSLIADIYPLRRRTGAMSVFFIAANVLASLGAVLSGTTIRLISNAHALLSTLGGIGPWRLSFLVAALPGLAFSIMCLFAREPSRLAISHEGNSGSAMTLSEYLRANWLIVVCICVGSVMAGAGSAAMQYWLPTILARSYGFSPADSAETFGVVWGVSAIGGTLLATYLIRRIQASQGVVAPLQVLRIGSLLTVTSLISLLAFRSIDAFIALSALHIFFSYLLFFVTPILLTVVAPSQFRGRITALYIATNLVFGSIWLTVIGVLSDVSFPGRNGLFNAFLAVTIPSSLVGPILLLPLVGAFYRTISNITDKGGALRVDGD